MGGSNPHAPKTSKLLQAILGRFYVTGCFWYRLHYLGATRVPRWVPAVVMPIFSCFFFLVLRNVRVAIAGNLRAVLGPCGWSAKQLRIWRTIWSFSWCLTERYEQFAPDRLFQLEVDGREHWDRALSASGGFLLATAHIGNWEAASRISVSESGRCVHVVRDEELNREAQAFVAQLLDSDSELQYRTHFLGDDVGLSLDLLAALREGEIVAMQIDRPSATGKTISVDLFDRPFHLPAGPLALARAAEAAVLPIFVHREGRRKYRVQFRDPIRVDATEDLQVPARILAREIEWAIRRDPHQWFCFRELWPD